MSLWCQKLRVVGSIYHPGDILSFALARFGEIEKAVMYIKDRNKKAVWK